MYFLSFDPASLFSGSIFTSIANILISFWNSFTDGIKFISNVLFGVGGFGESFMNFIFEVSSDLPVFLTGLIGLSLCILVANIILKVI